MAIIKECAICGEVYDLYSHGQTIDMFVREGGIGDTPKSRVKWTLNNSKDGPYWIVEGEPSGDISCCPECSKKILEFVKGMRCRNGLHESEKV